VPPLCVAGSAFAEGSPALAYGALLLFATNFVAIQLAGGGVFAAMGFARVAQRAASPRARNVGLAIVVIATLLLLIPLAAATGRLVSSAALDSEARGAVARWVDGSGYEVLSVTVKDAVVTVQITGTGAAPTTTALADLLSSGNPRPLKVRVLILPQELAPATASQPGGPAISASEATVPPAGTAATATISVPPSGTPELETGTVPTAP